MKTTISIYGWGMSFSRNILLNSVIPIKNGNPLQIKWKPNHKIINFMVCQIEFVQTWEVYDGWVGYGWQTWHFRHFVWLSKKTLKSVWQIIIFSMNFTHGNSESENCIKYIWPLNSSTVLFWVHVLILTVHQIIVCSGSDKLSGNITHASVDRKLPLNYLHWKVELNINFIIYSLDGSTDDGFSKPTDPHQTDKMLCFLNVEL